MTREGVFKLNRELQKDEDDEEDPWYQSIRQDQEKMLYTQCQKMQDSDQSESEDEEGHGNDDDYGEEEKEVDEKTLIAQKKEIDVLKRDLLDYLDKASNENANAALKRLRGNGL